MVTALACAPDMREARTFIEESDLAFEEPFDDLVGVHENGSLVAVGARDGNILKMFAVAPAHQGGPLLGELVTELVQRGFAAGHDSLFVFTKPEYAPSFESLNFSLLASHGRVALLEYGGGFERWLASCRPLVREGANGAAVMNCNPFTLGHRHLVEAAARACDHLYLFVVRAECSAFPFAARMHMVREGVAHILNCTVLDTAAYAVSHITFPSYFLKELDQAHLAQMELDLALFAGRIAPFFNIVKRFAGTEPLCPVTSLYNGAMERILPAWGIEPVEIGRKEAEGAVISASRVREALRRGDIPAVEGLVPETTLAWLRSAGAGPVIEKLKSNAGRH